jgi:hypothetical protein
VACLVVAPNVDERKVSEVHLRQGYGATVNALLCDASVDWSLGDYAPASASNNEELKTTFDECAQRMTLGSAQTLQPGSDQKNQYTFSNAKAGDEPPPTPF